MAIPSRLHTTPRLQLSYQLLRNVTSPDEAATEVRSFIANLPVFEILKLGTGENLRSYLAEYSPRKRTRVHEAIENTIRTEPQRFITRNSGFVIAASDIQVDDNKKTLRLSQPSIINGAQSQGEIRRWVEETYGDVLPDDPEECPFFVRAEIIIDADDNEVVETAIARNTATPVKSISQAGARHHLDDLEKSVKKVLPNIQISKSETDVGAFDTRKLLQYARLLMPPSVSGNETVSERLRPYKNPEQCLTEFSQWFDDKDNYKDKDKDREAAVRGAALRKYEFTIQIAPYAIREYEYWERHNAWNGHHIWDETKKGGRACRRDDQNRIVWISPGLVFPILGAMSEFVEEKAPGKWSIEKPDFFEPATMIANAVAQFRSKGSDPMLMGRDPGVYDALRIYPSTIVKVLRDMKRSRKEA
jgi:hypothetical protein